MSAVRTLTLSPVLQAGKAATKALIRAAGGQEAAEALTGRSQPRLSAYGLPTTDAFVSIELVAALEEVTHGTPNHPQVTRWLASQAGYLLVPKPRAAPGAGDLHCELGAVAKETGDVVQKVCEALRDGVVTVREIEKLRIREEIAEAQERLAVLDAMLAQISGER
jgi:hypothetical protein